MGVRTPFPRGSYNSCATKRAGFQPGRRDAPFLDEPTTGLHPQDTGRLLAVLLRLLDAGNTVVVVEHDFNVLKQADHVIDLGRGRARKVGMFSVRDMERLSKHVPESLTGDYLAGRRRIPLPEPRATFSWQRAAVRGGQGKQPDEPDGGLPARRALRCHGRQRSRQEQSRPGHALPCPASTRKRKKTAEDPGIAEVEVLGDEQIGDVVLMDQTPLPRN